MRYDGLRLGALCRGQAGRSRSVWVRPVVVRFGESGLGEIRYGGLGWVRSVVISRVTVWRSRLAAVRFGAACFGRSRTRCGGLGMVRSVWLRSGGRGEVSQVVFSSVEDWLVKAVKVRYVGVG
jgi:hypothetical protein